MNFQSVLEAEGPTRPHISSYVNIYYCFPNSKVIHFTDFNFIMYSSIMDARIQIATLVNTNAFAIKFMGVSSPSYNCATVDIKTENFVDLLQFTYIYISVIVTLDPLTLLPTSIRRERRFGQQHRHAVL